MSFNIQNLGELEISRMEKYGIWDEDCPVHYSRLRLLDIKHIDFDGNTNSGQLLVLDSVAEQVISIFKELYDLRFPIDSILLIDEFEGDDVRSMEANNTSAFNSRKVMGTNRWSSHAFGLAIDVNTVQNPYIRIQEETSSAKIYPSAGVNYVNRNSRKKGMVEAIVPIFAKHGFTNWGGNWENPLDYHHFQFPWDEIKQLFPDVPIDG